MSYSFALADLGHLVNLGHPMKLLPGWAWRRLARQINLQAEIGRREIDPRQTQLEDRCRLNNRSAGQAALKDVSLSLAPSRAIALVSAHGILFA